MWKWVDPPRSRRVEPVRSEGWGVHRQRQRMGVVVGRGGVYTQDPWSSKGCPQCCKIKVPYARVLVWVRAYMCACVRGAREFVCVVAVECLWDPLVEGGIIIVTTTTTTTPEDDLDYTATAAATPHAALAGGR